MNVPTKPNYISRREVIKLLGTSLIIPLISSCGGGGGGGSSPPAISTGPVVTYKPYGLNFGPYIDGQNPAQNQIVSTDQIRARLQIIAANTSWVRTFGSQNGLQNTAGIASSLGLSVAAGAYLSTNLTSNEVEIANLIAIGVARQAGVLVVGNETLLTNALTESQLIGYLRRVKQVVPTGVKVTTADTYDQLLAHPAVIAEVDLVAANFYPYFEGIDLKYAIAYLDKRYAQVKALAGSKEVMVFETGWPSGGVNNGSAVVSPENAASYFINFVSWAKAKSVNYFYFEAMDETWKAAVEGPQGSHWGIWDKNGVLKPGMQDVFDGKTVADNWSGATLIGGPGTPQVSLNFVPAIGGTDNLRGSVIHVIPDNYKMAVYIQVFGGWWTKPIFTSPLTLILPDGSWICDITTGGSDTQATSIAAFLVPNGYNPPLLSGGGALPAELNTNAVAKVMVTR